LRDIVHRLEKRNCERLGLQQPRGLRSAVDPTIKWIPPRAGPGLNAGGAPVAKVGFGPADQLASDSPAAMCRMDDHHADHAVGELECRFAAGRTKAGMSEADDSGSVDSDGQAGAIEIRLRHDDIVEDVAAESAGGAPSEPCLMPEPDQPREIGV